MKTILHKAGTRGYVDHGWLKSHHTFSFGGYRNPERTHFGVLRVINDDHVQGGEGFGTHPHKNMEIISMPLEGDLEHKDSMGTNGVIKESDIQVMSAGTGITHSEYNANPDQAVKFLQIWLFPNKDGVEPRYDQMSLKDLEKQNEFYQILSPNQEDKGVWIHQDAYFSMGTFDADQKADYTLKSSENGLYIFVIFGEVLVEGQELISRDGLGISEVNIVNFTFKNHTKILLMEIPMELKSLTK